MSGYTFLYAKSLSTEKCGYIKRSVKYFVKSLGYLPKSLNLEGIFQFILESCFAEKFPNISNYFPYQSRFLFGVS